MLNSRLSALLLCALSMFASSARAEELDGRWWNRLGEGEKLSYAVGFFAGTKYAVVLLTGATLKAMTDPRTGKFNASRAETAKAVSLEAMQAIQDSLSSVTAGQVKAGLDATYADYRNQGISVSDCIYVVIRGINGASDADVTRLLEIRRNQAGK